MPSTAGVTLHCTALPIVLVVHTIRHLAAGWSGSMIGWFHTTTCQAGALVLAVTWGLTLYLKFVVGHPPSCLSACLDGGVV